MGRLYRKEGGGVNMSDEQGNSYYDGPEPSDNRGTCRSCKADILWIKSKQKDGTFKNVPVNAVARMMWVEMDETWKLIKAYESHFVTCPNAKDFRKPR